MSNAPAYHWKMTIKKPVSFIGLVPYVNGESEKGQRERRKMFDKNLEIERFNQGTRHTKTNAKT